MSMSRLEAVLASIDSQAESAHKKLDQAQEFADRSQYLEVAGSSGDEIVTATVDGTGQVVAFDISDDVRSLDGAQVAASVMEAMGQAQRRLSFRVEQLGTEIYGEGSPSVETFTRAYRDKFGYEEEDA